MQQEMVHGAKHFTVIVMRLTPDCSAPIWPAVPFSSAAVRVKMSLRSADGQIRPNSAVFCFFFVFSPWRTLACLLSFCFCLLLWACLDQTGRAINPALHRLLYDDTDNNLSLSALHDESHLLVSSQNTPSIREVDNLFLLFEGREHLKKKKFQRSSGGQNEHISGDVSNSFYGSGLGQEWEFFIRAGLD